MKKKIKCYLVNAGGKPKTIEIDDSCDGIKEAIDLIDGYIDCCERKIGQTYYDIWIDDEGLMKENEDGELFVGGVCRDAYELLCGNILISKSDGNGGMKSLSDKDIENIEKHMKLIQNGDKVVLYETCCGVSTCRLNDGCFVLEYSAY